MQKLQINVQKNQKIRDFLLNYGFSSAQTNKILKNKDVKLDGVRLNENDFVYAGQSVVVFCEEAPQPKFETIYEDENVLIVNKGAGIEVQGENSLEECTKTIAVHRLDRNTTGIVILAKTKEAENALKQAFKKHNIQKKYVCEVFGRPNFNGEEISAYLVKDSKRRAISEFFCCRRRLKFRQGLKPLRLASKQVWLRWICLQEERIKSGAHLAYMGFPIIGDGKYGKNQITKNLSKNIKNCTVFI